MNKRLEIEGFKKNLCRAFILPMVGIDYKKLPINLINCYITWEYEVILVYDKTRNYNDVFYHYLDNRAKVNPNLTNYDDLEEELVLTFKVPDIFKYDYDVFMSGAYSEFSEYYKKILCSYYGKKSIDSDYTVTEYNVIYPEDFKRKQIAKNLSSPGSEVDYRIIKEVLDKPNLDREIFKPVSVLIAQNTNE